MSEQVRESSLASEEPCFGCPNLQGVSAIEGRASVHIRCNGDCPQVEPQVQP